ncbi:MAG: MBL fold metallo-hydrolase [Clostridiales bacterium]|nr:MBL fold metallo-hydrolase [Clostridiales bacterium]
MQEIQWIDLGGVNAYLVKKEHSFMLVDTGGHMFMDKQYDDRREKLEKQLLALGVTDQNLKLILLTHGDNDHACNAKYFRERFHAKIAMSSQDVSMVEKADPDCYLVNSNYESMVLKMVFKVMDSKIKKLMTKVYSEFERFTPDILLNDNDDLSTYGFDGRVYHVPGHTPGSIAILDSKGNLIAGDMFANNKKPSIAINAQDFQILRISANKILQKGVTMIHPGHGTPFEHSALRCI